MSFILKRADVKSCLIVQAFHAQRVSGMKSCVLCLAFKEMENKAAILFFVSYSYIVLLKSELKLFL